MRSWSPVLSLVALAVAGPARAGGGSFELAEPREAVQARIDAAIEASVATANWAIRGIARSRLQDNARICPGYRIDVSDTTFTVKCDDRPEFVRRFDDTSPWVTPKGAELPVDLSKSGQVVKLSFASDTGGKSFAYDLAADPGLVVTFTIDSPYLDKPVVWTAAYRPR